MEEKDQESSKEGWILFVFALFMINILNLNTLIAILGDRYEKVT